MEKQLILTESFVPQVNCGQFIDLHGHNLIRSKLQPPIPNFRTSNSKKLDNSVIPDPLLQKVSEITKLPISHQEPWEIIRYSINEKFDSHYDGQGRKFSVIFYLNSPECGGNTLFRNAKRSITPFPGKLIVWENDDYYSLHASMPVIKGVKWVLVTWVHPEEFISSKKLG